MEENKKLTNIIRALITVIVAVLIILGLSEILILKSEDGVSQLKALYRQPEESIDVIFLGSSLVYCDIATGILWDDYGMAAYDLGGAEAPAWVSYYQLKEALKTQKPKAICYEVSVATLYPTLFQADNWATDNSYGMKWNSNRISQLRINSEDKDYYNRLIPLNIMHGRYNDLEENDFTDKMDTADFKGFKPKEKVYVSERPDMSGVTGTEPCSEKAEEYIRKIIALTKEEGIPLIMFASPYCISESGKQMYNYMQSLADSEGVEFIDFNEYYDEIGIDFETDMADLTHLNYSGNPKFTRYFGSLLKDRFDLPDRRGDSRYISWEWDSALQSYDRNDKAICRTDDAGEVLEMTKTGYIVFGTNEGKAYIIDNGEAVEEGQEGFRMPYRSGDDHLLFIEEGEGDYKHYCSLFVNDVQYKEEYGNWLFVYDAVRHEFVRSIGY